MRTNEQKVRKVVDSHKVFRFLATLGGEFEITLSTSDYERRSRCNYPPVVVAPDSNLRSSTQISCLTTLRSGFER